MLGFDFDRPADARNGWQSLLNKTRGSREPLENLFEAIGSFRRRSQTDNLLGRQHGQHMNETLRGNVMHFVDNDRSKALQKFFGLATLTDAFDGADDKVCMFKARINGPNRSGRTLVKRTALDVPNGPYFGYKLLNRSHPLMHENFSIAENETFLI